ncbi:TraR/DksA C4-type zinc finger protein [Salmonella enterica]|uniref:TraR/DksA C4-type zinc finger protein n=1 Tax=Salmonella enterica TaxID=28901 RepID=UPI003D31F549
MQKNNNLNNKKPVLNWQTVSEAVKIINQSTGMSLTESDIYRHALDGDIFLSVYFQSPVVLRKTSRVKNKIKLRDAGSHLIKRLCYLESLIEKKRFRPASSESLYYCRLCGEPIPEERRKILPGVDTCFDCKSENERRQR